MLLIGAITALMIQPGLAASGSTIPAGTHLIVKTLETVGYTDAPGTTFKARLVQDIVVNAHVALAAGTQFTGKVITSRRLASVSANLTVDLTEVVSPGGSVPLKTTGPSPMEGYTSSGGVSVARGAYQVAAGRTLHFRLAQPLKL